MIEFILDLFAMFLHMLLNIKILILYGIFLASFSLIPKVKSYYLAKNFVLIWFVSSFLSPHCFAVDMYCCLFCQVQTIFLLLILLYGYSHIY